MSYLIFLSAVRFYTRSLAANMQDSAAMISLLLTLVVIGVVLWLVETKIPMDDTIKVAIRVVVVICVVLFLLRMFGVADLPLPRLR